MTLLKLTVIGRLGQDATVRRVNESNVISFSVAYNYRDRTGKDNTIWVNCSWWNDDIPKVVEFLKKGRAVYVEGIPSTRVYPTKDGGLRASLDCRVTQIKLLPGSRLEAPMEEISTTSPSFSMEEEQPFSKPEETTTFQSVEETPSIEPQEEPTTNTPETGEYNDEDDLPF